MAAYDDLTAEFYDLSALGSGRPAGSGLPPEVSQYLRPDLGPLVDLGAGTGLSTVALAEQLPEAEVFAVEQSGAMRAVLVSRLLARPDLRGRVTVVPGNILTARLPPVWGGLTACGLMGQLLPGQRRTLWSRLARQLAPGAAALIDRPPAQEPACGCHEVFRSESALGQYDYRVHIEQDVPVSGEARNLVSYTVTDRTTGEPVASHTYEREIVVVTAAELEREVAAVGLVTVGLDEHHLLVTRPGC